MKVPVISSLLLMLGIASPLSAIERPKALDQPVQDKQPAERAVPVEEPQEDLKEEEESAWLGVFSQTADEALSAQLGIDRGVVLRFVAEDSPAAKAGLKVHDVIAKAGGEVVATQEDLRAAVQEHQPGDELKMEVVSGGVKKEVAVVLGGRPEEIPQVPMAPMAGGGAQRLPELRRQWKEFMVPGGEFEKEMEEQFKRMEEQLERMERQPGLLNLELNNLLKNLPKGENGMKLDFKAAGSVKLLDEQGSVEMKMADGGVEVEVRDPDGELLYEGPWDNEQDKAAVDPEMKERIERLNFNGDGGALKLHFHQGPNFPKEPKAEPEAEPAAEEAAE